MKKIAILSAGRVEWPRFLSFEPKAFRQEPVLGLTESKQALAILTPKLRDMLIDKEYEVVFSEPVGIGYYNLFYKENWVIEKYGEEEKQFKKWQIMDNSPAFEYPIVQNNQQFHRSVRNIFEQIELVRNQGSAKTFTLSKNDLEVIREVTGADTICFNLIYGQKFSTGRKVATAFTYSSGSVKDMVVSFWIFVDASSGEVLWQGGSIGVGMDPANPKKMDFNKTLLKYFPKANQTMDITKCKKKDPVGPIYQCR